MSREKRAAKGPRRPCCMVSELLEEAGIDRERLVRIRRQVLEGIILMCQWQLQRMERDRPAPAADRRGRKVEVE
ncbi:MAG TPA: hypothetical protein VLF95_02625 [Vicinamibacteria bacterium]|nr:hypothetical protein [Vicinamibacteria bacterium]